MSFFREKLSNTLLLLGFILFLLLEHICLLFEEIPHSFIFLSHEISFIFCTLAQFLSFKLFLLLLFFQKTFALLFISFLLLDCLFLFNFCLFSLLFRLESFKFTLLPLLLTQLCPFLLKFLFVKGLFLSLQSYAFGFFILRDKSLQLLLSLNQFRYVAGLFELVYEADYLLDQLGVDGQLGLLGALGLKLLDSLGAKVIICVEKLPDFVRKI